VKQYFHKFKINRFIVTLHLYHSKNVLKRYCFEVTPYDHNRKTICFEVILHPQNGKIFCFEATLYPYHSNILHAWKWHYKFT